MALRRKPIASPLSRQRAQRAAGECADGGRGEGRAAGARGAAAGRSGRFPPQTLQPGSAVAVGYSNGDVRTSAIGTVAYVDGDRIWVFGHQLEGNGRRALLLQDAYVFRIINNPLQIGTIAATYKLAASGHDLGTVTNDGFSAVAGRTRRAAAHRAGHRDRPRRGQRRGQRRSTRSAADEAAVDLPSGGSWTSVDRPARGRPGRQQRARQHARAA